MKHAVLIALLVAACGGDDNEQAPPCAVTAADLLAPTETNRACINTLFVSDRPRAAQVLGQLDWVNWKDTTAKLDALPVDSRTLYLVALEPKALPRAALSTLQVARTKAEGSFVNDIDLAVVRIAMRAGDESTANTAIERMLPNDALIGAQKLELLELLSTRSEQPRIERICRKANEAAIAWRCLELAPSLPESLAACGRLPVLSYRDVEKFKPLRDKLFGLRCMTEGPKGLRWMFMNISSASSATAEEITIYSRLALDAPPEKAKCFLEEAARGCLARLRRDSSCPVLDALARYVAIGDDEDRAKAFSVVVGGKNAAYNRLEDQSDDARANLFHFHVILGEILVASPTLFPSPSAPIQIPNYHVIRAHTFWESVKDKTVTFADMLTPALRAVVCDNRSCTGTCQAACAQVPASACQLGERLVEDICNSR